MGFKPGDKVKRKGLGSLEIGLEDGKVYTVSEVVSNYGVEHLFLEEAGTAFAFIATHFVRSNKDLPEWF